MQSLKQHLVLALHWPTEGLICIIPAAGGAVDEIHHSVSARRMADSQGLAYADLGRGHSSR